MKCIAIATAIALALTAPSVNAGGDSGRAAGFGGGSGNSEFDNLNGTMTGNVIKRLSNNTSGRAGFSPTWNGVRSDGSVNYQAYMNHRRAVEAYHTRVQNGSKPTRDKPNSVRTKDRGCGTRCR